MKQIKDNKKVKKTHKIAKTIILTIISILVVGIVAGAGMVLAIIKTSPSLDINQILDLNQTSVIYDDKGNSMDDVITTDKNKQVVKRTDVSLDSTSQYLGPAFIAIEDARFRQHGGVDYKGITRALFVDVQNKISHGNKSTQGASTITQQLIKNRLFLEDSVNNRLDYARKIQEAYLAIELDKSMTKNDILEAYMNTIFLGGNAYGVEAAAYQYFSKTSNKLTLVESAFIAGMAQSPSGFYPFTTSAEKNPDVYINKTKLVLSRMYETNSISEKEYDDAINSIKINKIVFIRPNENLEKYTYESFSVPVIEQIKTDLMAKYNYSTSQVKALLMRGGLKIYTTMDKNLQVKSQKILDNDSVFNKVYNESKNEVQSSAVILDYHTGQVKAIIGGRGEQPAMSYNRAVDAINFPRSTGSSIKPLTVYAAAIDSKQALATTILDDSPLSPEIANRYITKGVPYNPSDDNQPEGPITMYSAIKTSQNLAAIKLEDQIGVKTGYAYAKKFGLNITTADENISTMALGQFHGGETPLLMAAAYGVFGNSGLYTSPRLYTKVVDKTGKVLLETSYTTRKAIDPVSAYTMYDLLKGPVSLGGTGTSAKYGDMPVAGKTGTATDSKDLWFCGLTPYYSAAVWIGNDDYKKFSNLSSNDAALIWGKLMKEANVNLPIKDITPPDGIEIIPQTIMSNKTIENIQRSGQD
ncbi:PBP1A family penicillin-binding protein [Clostridium estertheticum]|uniref:transglycosylase domain-containing protein n=1 Tax=Clostridium estertheticum TaxID=238834 RepID=UPI001CF213F5|nr:PBP1A family penicillin-binding protein [Clostridium estertheticum]MCB2307074.1 PBP1A family penicillin-binding protein [Clostridium estertheticum]MCB2345883.1 PBP1A family penicillin-binding protein [Clostridium estertheticum]MCB2350526.1 PBP1A family penicillin-binding protein [Clostridium estertheticum]WAG45435.1 PBP1A family penicillin-binding protein [Clostridium estertheticum]